MPYGDFDHEELTRILTESFTVLANEVQVITIQRAFEIANIDQHSYSRTAIAFFSTS
jgi:hypothetical protein